MTFRHHTRLLFLVAAAVATLLVMLAPTGIAGAAQEGDDPLSRYDSEATAEMARQYEADRKRAEELEDEIEAAEDAGEWESRSDLHEELSEMTDATDSANALGDARLSDIESAPLPDSAEEKAAELRKKAASLDALQAWAATAPINIDSRL